MASNPVEVQSDLAKKQDEFTNERFGTSIVARVPVGAQGAAPKPPLGGPPDLSAKKGAAAPPPPPGGNPADLAAKKGGAVPPPPGGDAASSGVKATGGPTLPPGGLPGGRAGAAAAQKAATPPKPKSGAGRAVALRVQAELERNLAERGNDRATLKKPLAAGQAEALKKVERGPELVTALEAFQALDASKKNGSDALARLGTLVAESDRWLAAAAQVDPKPQALIDAVTTACEAARREQKKLTEIRGAVTKLATPEPDFERTGVWNKTGGVRIKSMGHFDAKHPGPSDAGSRERLLDTKRQVEKFNALLDDEVSRSDAFAELLLASMNDGDGKSFDMVIGKGAAGAWDDFNTLGVDVDDLDCLPKDPVAVGGTKGGVTKGEIMAHVFEERMYGFKGTESAAYDEAHRLCLSPGSFQNRHRREIGIPADSILYDNCKHSHTKSGCSCFEALDTQGSKTIVHDIPGDLKHNKTLAETQQTDANVPGAEHTEVIRAFDSEAATLDAIIRKAVAVAKKGLFESKSPWNWTNAEAQDLLHFITIACHHDEGQIDGRKADLQKEFDAYRKAVDNKAALRPELEAEKVKADEQRRKGDTPAELALNERREARPPAVNVGSAADGSTNCAMCTLGAILNLTSEQAALKGQQLSGGTKPDPKMQSEKLFYNAFLGIDDNTEDSEAKRLPLLEAKLGKDYIDEVKARLAPGEQDWAHLQGEIMGDLQFEGLRLMLEDGIAERNTKSGVKYEVVQDGLPAEGKLYPWAAMVTQMAQYPDGTQFQAFVRGPEMPGHWIYADKVKGKVLFEDYQKNVEVKVQVTQAVPTPKDYDDAKKNFHDPWKAAYQAVIGDEPPEDPKDYEDAKTRFEEQWRSAYEAVMNAKPPADPTAGPAPDDAQQQAILMSVSKAIEPKEMQRGRIHNTVVNGLKKNAPKTEESYRVPNSAYVADAGNSPRHPQSDKPEVFKEGMFFAVLPQGAAKPPAKDASDMEGSMAKVRGKLKAASGRA